MYADVQVCSWGHVGFCHLNNLIKPLRKHKKLFWKVVENSTRITKLKKKNFAPQKETQNQNVIYVQVGEQFKFVAIITYESMT